jgi:hypothetical protein
MTCTAAVPVFDINPFNPHEQEKKPRGMPACRLSVAIPHLAFAAAARSVLREPIGRFGPASAMGYIGSRNGPENRRRWIAGPDRASADYLRGVRANRHRSAFHFMMEVKNGVPQIGSDRLGREKGARSVSPMFGIELRFLKFRLILECSLESINLG